MRRRHYEKPEFSSGYAARRAERLCLSGDCHSFSCWRLPRHERLRREMMSGISRKGDSSMFKKTLIVVLLLVAFAFGTIQAVAQSPAPSQKRSERKARPFFFGTGPNLPVLGAGTVGQLTMWTGFSGTNAFIGDSIITETKLGQIGIGTTTPTSTLTVQGMIEATTGGFKFPDGTVQTTSASAALLGVSHDSTLTGNGSTASPLGVAVPLSLVGNVPNLGHDEAVLKATNTADGGTGVTAAGGAQNNAASAGSGIVAQGGHGISFGGAAVFAEGGTAGQGDGGSGIEAFAGTG